MTGSKRAMAGGFVVGALVPVFWGVLGFVLFNLPEGPLSRAFWIAVYATCPFWRLEGQSAVFLMPLLNGCAYATVAFLGFKLFRIVFAAADYVKAGRAVKKVDSGLASGWLSRFTFASSEESVGH